MSGYLEKCEEEIMNLVLEFTGKVEKEQLKYKDLVQLYRTRIGYLWLYLRRGWRIADNRGFNFIAS